MIEENVQPSILVRTEDGARWVSFNRPKQANSIDMAFATALRDMARELRGDTNVVVLKGSARFFSAGGDLAAMQRDSAPSHYLFELVEVVHEAVALLGESSAVVISVVEGTAAGAGFSLVLNSDLVLAAPTARFLSAYGSVGLTPDTGLSFLLPRVVGARRANELMLQGRVIDADTAHDWGIVNEVVDSAQLRARVRELVSRLVGMSGPALAETKRLIRRDGLDGYRDHLDEEAHTISRMMDTPEAQQRITAFLAPDDEKRAERA